MNLISQLTSLLLKRLLTFQYWNASDCTSVQSKLVTVHIQLKCSKTIKIYVMDMDFNSIQRTLQNNCISSISNLRFYCKYLLQNRDGA